MISRNYRKIWAILTAKERRRSRVLLALDVLISVADILFLSLLVYGIKYYAGVTSVAGGATGALPNGGVSAGAMQYGGIPTAAIQHAGIPVNTMRYGGPEGMLSIWVVVLFFLLFSLKNLAGYLVYRAQCGHLYAIASRLSSGMLSHYLEGEWMVFAGKEPAVLVREIGFFPLEFCQHVLGGLQQIITQAVLILLTIVAMLVFDARLFLLLAVILAPPVSLVFRLLRRRSLAAGQAARSSGERALQYLQEALAGFVESNIYQKNAHFLERYNMQQAHFNQSIARHSVLQNIPPKVIEVFALTGILLLMAVRQWMGHPDQGGLISIGVFMAAAYRVIPGLVKMLGLSGQLSAYSFTIDKLYEEGRIGRESSVEDADRIRSVRFLDVRFRYADRLILDGQGLSIAAGEMVGISGASGRGKTTMLNLLLGFLEPEEGGIEINGVLTGPAARRGYWRDIAYVKQQPFLLHDNILENITLGERPYDETRLQTALGISGLECGTREVSGQGRDISGGQRQRIAIARALYKDPDLFILDEPFNELDGDSEHRLLRHFRDLAAAGKMVLLITHNKQSLSYCDKIVCLDEATC